MLQPSTLSSQWYVRQGNSPLHTVCRDTAAHLQHKPTQRSKSEIGVRSMRLKALRAAVRSAGSSCGTCTTCTRAHSTVVLKPLQHWHAVQVDLPLSGTGDLLHKASATNRRGDRPGQTWRSRSVVRDSKREMSPSSRLQSSARAWRHVSQAQTNAQSLLTRARETDMCATKLLRQRAACL